MTVAALVLARSSAEALADAAGRPACRRIAESAWAGGALPVIVVSPAADDALTTVLSGSTAILAVAAEIPGPGGEAAGWRRGAAAAAESVAETDAVLLWPASHAWVDPETVTSLIQAHGLDVAARLAPRWAGEAGWPVLVPVADLEATLTTLAGSLAGGGAPLPRVRLLDLGDPGAVLDLATAPADLPAYLGPTSPLAPPPEWGAAAAERPDDAPLEGARLSRDVGDAPSG